MRDGHLKGADFLDVEKYPEIVFTLKSIAPDGDHFKVTGDLTIKDVTHELTLDYEHSGSVQRSLRQHQGRRHADRDHDSLRLGPQLERARSVAVVSS